MTFVFYLLLSDKLQKSSPKSYSKGLREAFLCRSEVYQTVVFL